MEETRYKWFGKKLQVAKKTKTVLNVGGGSKEIGLPLHYMEYEHVLLDIDPRGEPDIVCDARELRSLPRHTYDAVYCAHNLEHFYHHEVPVVLAGFHHVLKRDGFVDIRVPDIIRVMKIILEKNLDLEDELYVSQSGPIMPLDVIWGFTKEIEESGQPYYAHKTGFTSKSLTNALNKAGFSRVVIQEGNLELQALGYKR